MIDGAVSLARLALGLAGVFFLGAGMLAVLLPRPRQWSRLERAACSFGAGTIPLTLWMLALTWWGRPYSLPLILGPLLAAAAGALAAKRVSSKQLALTSTEDRKPKTENCFWNWLFLSLLFLLFLFATLRAGLYPMWAWDAIATWGCKAKVFYESRGLDLTCIEAHNYYPNLVPLLLTYLYLCLGQVNDQLVNLLFPLWGALLLMLLYSFGRRLGLPRTGALGLCAFLALNGATFITHLYIAYADLALTYFTLGAAGLLYLWLQDATPRGGLGLAALFMAGLAWCKYEGAPLAGTLVLAAALTLLWLRPPQLWRCLGELALPLAGVAAGWLPWRLYVSLHHLEGGADHVLGFYPHQLWGALPRVLWGLVDPALFGILWPAALLAGIFCGRRLWSTPRLFLALFLGGNLIAILLAYALAPTSEAEFLQYIRGTLDRLLLHLAPVAALLAGEGLKDFS
jgi:hypothetical protein